LWPNPGTDSVYRPSAKSSEERSFCFTPSSAVTSVHITPLRFMAQYGLLKYVRVNRESDPNGKLIGR
jgi:hypothetical protein